MSSAALSHDPSRLAQRLRTARRVRGLSQPQLAQACGLSQPQISRLESGQTRDPLFTTVAAVAAALDVSLDALADPNADRFLADVNRDEELDAQVVVGISRLTGAPVAVNRFAAAMPNAHMLIAGVPGSGGSFAAKLDLLRWQAHGVAAGVVDFTGEYVTLAQRLGGQIIRVGAGATLNPMVGPGRLDAVTLTAKRLAVAAFLNDRLREIGAPALDAAGAAAVDRVLADHGYSPKAAAGHGPKRPRPMTLSSVMASLTSIAAAGGLGGTVGGLERALAPYLPGGRYASLFGDAPLLEEHAPVVVFDLSAIHDPHARMTAAAAAVEQMRVWWMSDPEQADHSKRLLVLERAELLGGADGQASQIADLMRRARRYGVAVTLVANSVAWADKRAGRPIATDCAAALLLRQRPEDAQALNTLGSAPGPAGNAGYLSGADASALVRASAGEGLLLVGGRRDWVVLRGSATSDEYAALSA